MPHLLDALPYAYDALEPYIDRRTMELHHSAHHATYVKNLNAALDKYPNLQSKPLDRLLRDVRSRTVLDTPTRIVGSCCRLLPSDPKEAR